MSTLDKVREVISNQTGWKPEEIGLEHKLEDDLGVDSLDQAELAMSFETDFNIDIPDEEAEKIKTVDDAVQLIDKKLAEREAA